MISAPSSQLVSQSNDTTVTDADVSTSELAYQRRKVALHERLVNSLNLSAIGLVSREDFSTEVSALARELTEMHAGDLSDTERKRMIEDLADEVFGLGPLEPLMRDPDVSDILVNHPHEVFIERKGLLEPTNIVFADATHLMRIIQRLTAKVGRRVDEVSPMVDARLPDGSRVNAIVPPLAVRGPSLSIRRFGTTPLTIDDLVHLGSLTPAMRDFLAAAVMARISILISGGAGAGKTTLLNGLSQSIPDGERIITIEDAVELKLQNRHVMQLETRPSNTEGKGEVTQRDLLRNALRMRPDRILIGEVRSGEALDMLQAMNTGHEGSLGTIHANDVREALERLEMMVAMSNAGLPVQVVRRYIASGVRLLIHTVRFQGGERKVTRISEIVGLANDAYIVNDIYRFEQQGIGAEGSATGEFRRTSYRPSFLARMRSAGIEVPAEIATPENKPT